MNDDTPRKELRIFGGSQTNRLIGLAGLVRRTRDAQRRYFRERSPQSLNASKDLERELDREVARILQNQRELFGE